MAIGTDIIKRFNLQVDDSSELSSNESLALANEVYQDIQNDRNWEWLKSEFTGVTSTTVPYITLPVDFKMMSLNLDNEAVVFVGTDLQIYKVVSFSSRRDYRDSDGYCYVDLLNNRLVFTKQPTEVKPVEYDYIIIAPALLFVTSPLFKGHDYIISYGMAAKFNPIELTDKAVSYQRENKAEYERMLSDMRMEDSLIKLQLS